MPPRTTKDRIHTDRVKYPDFIEVGKVGARLHISFNANNLGEALERVDSAFVVRDYTVNELMKVMEKEIKKGGKKE
jgi:hypothetical protein